MGTQFLREYQAKFNDSFLQSSALVTQINTVMRGRYRKNRPALNCVDAQNSKGEK